MSYELSGPSAAWAPTAGGGSGTFSDTIQTDRGQAPYRLAKWRGEPGIYDRPGGMPWSEVFVVYTGKGRVRFNDETVELSPGVTVDLQKGVPYVFEIDEAIEKVAVITL